MCKGLEVGRSRAFWGNWHKDRGRICKSSGRGDGCVFMTNILRADRYDEGSWEWRVAMPQKWVSVFLSICDWTPAALDSLVAWGCYLLFFFFPIFQPSSRVTSLGTFYSLWLLLMMLFLKPQLSHCWISYFLKKHTLKKWIYWGFIDTWKTTHV